MTQKPDDLDLIMLSIQDYNLKHKGEEQLVLAVDKPGHPLRRHEQKK
jgi:hypothetical protein